MYVLNKMVYVLIIYTNSSLLAIRYKNVNKRVGKKYTIHGLLAVDGRNPALVCSGAPTGTPEYIEIQKIRIPN